MLEVLPIHLPYCLEPLIPTVRLIQKDFADQVVDFRTNSPVVVL